MGDIQSILDPATIPQSVKADAWDAYQAATSPADLAQRMDRLPLPKSVKADLWDAKSSEISRTAPVSPVAPGPATRPSSGWVPLPEEAKHLDFWKPSDQPPEKQGFFRSMYDESVAPIVGMISDAFDRGDLGEHSAQQMLGAFRDQLWNFQQHPDIRNLPIVGPGATAIANRMQAQYNAGNYKGMFGTAAGFLGPLLAPEATAAISDNMPAISKAAADAADATGDFASAAGKATAAGAKAAAPDIQKALFGGGIAQHFGSGLGELASGAQGALGIYKGVKAGRAAWAEERAAQAAADAADAAAAARSAAGPRVPIWQKAAEDAAAAKASQPEAAAPAEQPTAATPPMWAAARSAQAEAQAAEAEAGAQATQQAPPEVNRDVIDERPDARTLITPDAAQTAAPAAEPETDLEAQLRASIAQANARRAAVHAPTPAQLLEDRIDEHHAYTTGQAEDIMWANRARKADRIAQYLVENNLEATPENMNTAARHLAERKAPSPETAAMIQDRVEWHGRQSDYEQPAAAGTAGEMDAGATGEVDPGTTGTRGTVSFTPRPGARNVRATGDGTEVDVPGEDHSYPARYEVREMSEVQPSHNPHNFNENPQYQHENDRNYDDPENQRKIIDWSQGRAFKPRNLLNTGPDSSIGPPVIDGRGNVLGGNGRTMILSRVYENNPGGAAAYRAELDRTASHYGIDPDSYAHMKQPVLVRTVEDGVVNTPEGVQQAITDFNKTGTAALTPAERAIADARRVSVNTLEDISKRMDAIGPDATLAQALEGKSGGEVLARLMDDGVISPQEGAQLRRGGALTRAGQDRISGLMLGRFFSNAKQLDALPAALRNKMERLAAPLARVEGDPVYSLSPQIRRALDLVEDAGAHDMTLDDFTKQSNFFSSHNYPPDVVTLAKNLQKRNPVALTQAVRDYAEHAKYAAEYQGPGMFNEFPDPVGPGAAFRELFSEDAMAKESAEAAAARARKKTGTE